jgi:hypothetical protein
MRCLESDRDYTPPRRVYSAHVRRDNDADTPRCPVCRHWLIARVDCRGPYFHCLCDEQRRRKKRSAFSDDCKPDARKGCHC